MKADLFETNTFEGLFSNLIVLNFINLSLIISGLGILCFQANNYQLFYNPSSYINFGLSCLILVIAYCFLIVFNLLMQLFFHSSILRVLCYENEISMFL